MELTVMADAAALTLQFLRMRRGGRTASDRNDEMVGAPKGDPVPLDWTGQALGAGDDHRPDGRLADRALRRPADDRRRPGRLRAVRPPAADARRRRAQLVVLPTNTWQAYNMYDRDGDGWGDTWYAGGNPPVDLDPPVPRSRRAAALQALRPRLPALARTGRAQAPTCVAEDDLEAVASGDELRALYDLVVFPGHSEYMTAHAYDVVERFRDLGGRLIFLSANNFFWRVEKEGDMMRRVKPFRERGPARGTPRRRAVPRQRRRLAAGRVHCRRRGGGAMAVRQDRPRDRLDASARRWAATASRSTRRRPTRRRARRCWR